ncbi:hypothetical protein CROQUDRAFT_40763 [Cronartium quercuum f. sp. fusiforme G11]|uniref:FHA domain-containing protein n=1 Tax=Cronartium quercuum f. sp. fusiforme G11 TaxID=708437 RepID=A0A9P6TDY2_9BASI|nr:hypothetical protein CROQUDRAFT_40763 [Cronartium quercuum f. sp. fusiforme G11]
MFHSQSPSFSSRSPTKPPPPLLLHQHQLHPSLPSRPSHSDLDQPTHSRSTSPSPSLASSPPSPLFSDSPFPVPSSVTHATSPSRFSSTCIQSPARSPNPPKRLRLDTSCSHSPTHSRPSSPPHSSRSSSPISSPADSYSASFTCCPCDSRHTSPVRMVKPLSQSELTTNQLSPSSSTQPKRLNNLKPSSQLTSEHPAPLSRPPFSSVNENDEKFVCSAPHSSSQDLRPRPSTRKKSHKSPSPPLRLAIQPGYCMVFGRQPDLSAIPPELQPKDTPMVPIKLPGTFTHASRIHCMCTLIAPPLGGLSMKIVVRGQNGLTVDGERFVQGASAGVELERFDGEQIKLDFHGGKTVECYVKFDDGLSPPRLRTAAVQSDHTSVEGLEHTRNGKRKCRSSNPTPITPGLEFPATPTIAVMPSPAVEPAITTQNATLHPPKRQCLSVGPEASPSGLPIPSLPVNDRLHALIPSLGLDLVGLIASAIVFFPRATVSTSEVIRGVLEAQPSLAEAVLSVLTPSPPRSSPRPTSARARSASVASPIVVKREALEPLGANAALAEKCAAGEEESSEERTERVINACRPLILEMLQLNWRADGSGMFGCVTNEGLKDASGQALEALWYYQPQRDPDLERRSNLQPCVRHVRHTQTTSKQYFFQRTREPGRRRS